MTKQLGTKKKYIFFLFAGHIYQVRFVIGSLDNFEYKKKCEYVKSGGKLLCQQ